MIENMTSFTNAASDWDNIFDEDLIIENDIPQTHTYLSKTIFVRECYPEYYNMVMELLSHKRMVTVTGTPGIGKSIFYLYFFHRYRAMNPEHKLLLASFTADRKLRDCCLYPALNHDRMQPEYLESLPKNPKDCSLLLYNGPPTVPPTARYKMVCFTSTSPSPHIGWLKEVFKSEDHERLFMPNWSFLEIKVARDVLRLNISDDLLNQRRAIFGEVARYVLDEDSEYVSQACLLVDAALKDKFTLEQIQDIFECKASVQDVANRIIHHVPDRNNCKFADLKISSAYIASQLEKNLLKKIKDERSKLFHMLESSGKTSCFKGWLYENFVHEIMLEGGNFTLRNLKNNEEYLLTINETQGNYKRFAVKEKLEEVLQDVYRIPDPATLESIDSYLLDDSALWLFQITLNVNHGVKLKGVLKMVDYLNLRERVLTTPLKVKLVFVVPPVAAHCFRLQTIETEEIFVVPSGDFSTMDCAKVPGIKTTKKSKLKNIGIETVQQLLNADVENISFVKAAVKDLRDNIGLMEEARTWSQQIEQYVLPISYQLDATFVRGVEEGI